MKSANILKIAPSDIVKMAWHAVAKAARPYHLKADVGKAKDFVFDALKKKTRAYGGITANYYRSLLHLPKPCKKPYNVSSSADAATSSYERQPVISYDACNNDDDDDSIINPVSSFILKRINEDQTPINLDEEIDRLANDFISTFHENFRLEKQRSYRQYQEMLARST